MKADFQGIKQAELAELTGAKHDTLKRFRDRELKRGEDWDKDGAVVYWTHEAAARFRDKYERPEPEQEPDLDLQTALVKRLPKNSAFVEIALDGVCVPVRIRKGAGKRLLGREIRFAEDEDGNFYHVP